MTPKKPLLLHSVILILCLLLVLTASVTLWLYRSTRRLTLETDQLTRLINRLKEDRDKYYKHYEHYRLQEETTRLRQLNFLKPVNYKTINKAELKTLIRQKAEEELKSSATTVEDYEKILVKFGLLAPDDRIIPCITALYNEQVQGIYNEDTGEMILVSGLPLTGSLHRTFMVHELTHVLQDQHFNLKGLPLDNKNEDRAQAALSLIEGDASLVMYLYYRDHLKIHQLFWDLLSYLSIDQTRLYTSPYYIRENLLFPYKWGAKFVTYLYTKGSWEEVNQAFRAPPESTEQIIHPEKYGKDSPVEVTIKDPGPAGWRHLASNTMGEFNIRILLSIYLGEHQSTTPSNGWGGDTWTVWEDPATGRLKLVWYTTWDTLEDADEFFSAARKLLRKRRVPTARLQKSGNHVKLTW